MDHVSKIRRTRNKRMILPIECQNKKNKKRTGKSNNNNNHGKYWKFGEKEEVEDQTIYRSYGIGEYHKYFIYMHLIYFRFRLPRIDMT